MSDPQKSLSEYWQSVCAAYHTVSRGRFEVGKDTARSAGQKGKEVFARAAASETALEHTIKLTYACWLESEHYKREEYLALASREVEEPSPFV